MLWYSHPVAAGAQRRRILAADVGGTHTRLALHETGAEAMAPLAIARLPSRDHASLDALLRAFLDAQEWPELSAACVAVAGPVIDGGVDVTNLPWHVDAQSLCELLGVDRLRLLNDVQAAAFGMLSVPAERFAVLQRGARARARGTVVVAAAGTGFGLAVLDWDGEFHHPRATEWGHVNFAPRSERDIEVWRHLRHSHARVSVEQVVSGPGIFAVYGALRAASGVAEPEALRARLARGDPSAVVTEAALAGEDPVCEAALEVFSEGYAAAAGDAALAQVALGGVWLGGGIAPKILPALERPAFAQAFRDKGRFEPLLASLSLEVCLEADTALLGAAQLALRDATDL